MRKFRIDASQKIYADVDITDYVQESILNYYIDSLIAYATPKLEKVYGSAEKELQDIIAAYVGQYKYDIVAFNDCVNTSEFPQQHAENPATEDTHIVEGLQYHADEDGAWTWIGIFFKDDRGPAISKRISEIIDRLNEDTEFQAEDGQYYLGDNCPYAIPHICIPETRDFIINLVLKVLTFDEYREMPEDKVIGILKQLIDGYCDFVYRYCTNRTNIGLQLYLADKNSDEEDNW